MTITDNKSILMDSDIANSRCYTTRLLMFENKLEKLVLQLITMMWENPIIYTLLNDRENPESEAISYGVSMIFMTGIEY